VSVQLVLCVSVSSQQGLSTSNFYILIITATTSKVGMPGELRDVSFSQEHACHCMNLPIMRHGHYNTLTWEHCALCAHRLIYSFAVDFN